MIKLADFGTAKEDAGKNFTVIGTPFWSRLVMLSFSLLVAPEIIEVSGATTVSGMLPFSFILTLRRLELGLYDSRDVAGHAALLRTGHHASVVQDCGRPSPSHSTNIFRGY